MTRRCGLTLMVAGWLVAAPALALTPADEATLKSGGFAIEELAAAEGGTVRATFDVNAPPAVCRAVLWDHERYPEFMPQSRTIRVLERHGDTQIVEMIGGQGPVTVGYVTERHLERDRISWRTLRGDVKENAGYWAFAPAGTGTRVTYQVHVVPKGPVPGGVVAFLQKQALPGMLKAVKQRIEQEAARRPAGP